MSKLRRLAVLATVLGVLLGSVGGGIAMGQSDEKTGDAMKKEDAAMKHDAATSSASMTG